MGCLLSGAGAPVGAAGDVHAELLQDLHDDDRQRYAQDVYKRQEQHLCFLGLTGMIDPVRPEVVDAIRACRGAGIRPVMITGDHVDTAKAIARELGLLGPGDEAVTGTELSAMDDETFSSRLRHISVYARVQPEHKTRIVRAWRDAGFVTAMTGDGVNDCLLYTSRCV